MNEYTTIDLLGDLIKMLEIDIKEKKMNDKFKDFWMEKSKEEIINAYRECIHNGEVLLSRIDKAIEMIDLIKPELWNISNKMTYRLIDIKNVLKGEDIK